MESASMGGVMAMAAETVPGSLSVRKLFTVLPWLLVTLPTTSCSRQPCL